MLKFVKGFFFDSEAQTLVNTVNCRGVMGKGVALEFKIRFPDMYEDYREKCKLLKIEPGKVYLHKGTTPWVLNFPTKDHWKSYSNINNIKLGLQDLVQNYKGWGITSLAMPALGCGHGGLDWDKVKPLIKEYLGDLEIAIEVYEPGSTFEQPEEIEYLKDLFGEPPPPTKKRKRRTSSR